MTNVAPKPEAILLAAKWVFLERGYELTSMDDVAARAGTTKRTVYNHFASKEQLFRAVVAISVAMFLDKLPPLSPGGTAARELEEFLARFVELSTWRGAIGLQRVLMAEAVRFPDLCAQLQSEVFDRVEAMLADYVRQAGPDRCGRGDARTFARQLIGAATSEVRIATLFGTRSGPDEPPGDEVHPAVDRRPIKAAIGAMLPSSGNAAAKVAVAV